MTVLDSWKNRAESSSYKANAAYQATLGLTFTPKLFEGSPEALWEAAKGITLYGFATTGHWLRAREEEEARAANKTMDEYYQAFSRGPAKYSQSYYGVTELIAVNAGHEPNAVASIIALSGIARALNDKKFWGAKEGSLKHLRQATAPRIFAASYTISTTVAALQGDRWFAASQAAWGWGNANFDLIGPKIKKAIKQRYAHDPDATKKALKGLEIIQRQVNEIEQETTAMTTHIKEENWDAAAKEAARLYDAAKDNTDKQQLYLEIITALAPATIHARKKLKQLGMTGEDTRSPSITGKSAKQYHEP